jgi:GT2 family glycosyltransferase/glycosyltransferase involved in cell wall biosynthesis
MRDKKITWIGRFDNKSAFGIINTKICEQLEKLGWEVYRNQHTDNDGQITPYMVSSQYYYKWEFEVEHPVTVGIVTNEFSMNPTGGMSMPKDFLNANKYDITLSLGDWVGSILMLNGIKNVRPIHLGVDYTRTKKFKYRTDKTTLPFTFMWVGGTDARHGWREAIQAFSKAFPKGDENVLLKMKFSTDYPAIADIPDDKRIVIERKDYKSMADFYADGDVLLYTCRAAGPGMPAMEALKLGIPVVTPLFSGMHDYAGGCTVPIKFKRVPMKHHLYDLEEAYWAELDIDDLSITMRDMYDYHFKYEEAVKLAEKAKINTWCTTAKEVDSYLTSFVKSPVISFVILTHNRHALLEKCIKSIKALLDKSDITYEVVIVDQAPNDWKPGYNQYQAVANSKLIRLDKNIGCGPGRNRGADVATGEFIIFMDDDASFTGESIVDMLQEAIDLLRQDHSIGVIGQTGGYVDAPNWGFFPKAEHRYLCDVAQGYFQMFRRGLWANGKVRIDEGFGKFWHEDSDMCLQLKHQGYKVTSLPFKVKHIGSASGDDGTYVAKAERLKNKWANHKVLEGKDNWNVKSI